MRRLTATLFLACLALAALAPSAFADFGVRGFDGKFYANQVGAPTTQAGSHPYTVGATVSLNLKREFHEENGEVRENVEPDGRVKDIDVELPAGLIGDPSATPKCPGALLAIPAECPKNTQIGIANVFFSENEEPFPLYNLTAPGDAPALLGFDALGFTAVHVTATVRPPEPGSTEGYGLDLHIHNIPEALPIWAAGLTFFGRPSEDGEPGGEGALGRPFVTLPTSCSGGPLTLRAHVTSWEGASTTASFAVHDQSGAPIHVEGCDRVPFEPKISTALDTTATDSPSGLNVEVQTPQNRNANGIATANLKSTTVTLPAGLTINPSAADGLVGCSVSQFDQFGEAPSTCPDNSKVGSVEIDTPLTEHPLTGGVYLAKQGENPFNSMLALYLVGEGDGIKVKLPGKVTADPSTGQLTATFEETPQLPFESLKLHFFNSSRSVLATPVTCGTRSVGASLTPWSTVVPTASTSSVSVSAGAGGGACPSSPAARPFAPGFEAGTVSPAAALHSPFSLTVTRPDGSQELGAIDATLPKGLLATLKGVPECAAANAAAGTCGPASQVGSVTAGAGAGPNPYYVKGGRAYLTGPYAGAPLGLDFVVPVQAGPLNLGNVNVRAALFVDPETAQVTVKSDPLPKILDGIPLRLRSLAIGIDRPGFIVNPTSCDQTEVTGRVTSTEGATANLASRFQAAGCGALAFAPKVAPRFLGARKALRRGGHPRLRVTVAPKPGGANLSDVALTLPKSILLDQSNIKTVCTRVQFAAEKCPKASVYGTASVTTPLLDKPLTGPVYLRSSSHTLPDLVFDLKGQIRIVLAGRIDSHKGGIRVSVAGIPDAAVSKFVLNMKGGAKGLLQSSTDLCAKKGRATVKTRGQNGAVKDSSPVVGASCGKARK